MSPVLIVAGAQKGGSTAVAQWLLGGERVVDLTTGECCAFEGHLPSLKARLLAGKAAGEIRRGNVPLIKRPEVFHNASVLFRASATFPNAIAVVALRNPVDRAISAWLHYWRHGLIPPVSLQDCIAAWKLGGSASPLGQIVAYSLYSESAKRFIAAFPDATVVFSETAIRSLEPLVERLGLRDLAPDLPIANTRAGLQAVAPRPSLLSGSLSYRWDDEFFTPRPLWPVGAAVRVLDRLTERDEVDDPAVSIVDREAIREAVIDDLDRLEHVIGQAVPSSWR